MGDQLELPAKFSRDRASRTWEVVFVKAGQYIIESAGTDQLPARRRYINEADLLDWQAISKRQEKQQQNFDGVFAKAA